MSNSFTATMGLFTAILAFLAKDTNEPHDAIFHEDQRNYRIMFYNTENFFDTRDDSLTSDNDFTPRGAMHWNYSKYNFKLNNLYKTIVALGGWQPPDIIGICEVENEFVLADLLNHTPLVKHPYRVIHSNSPDRRGIDVALLYNSKTVRFIQNRYFKINRPGLFTRDILYFKAILDGDTCHFFMNHWPSRSAGQLKTEADRFSAASELSIVIDSLLKAGPDARIIIMGDFNDEPDDESISVKLKVKTDLRDLHSDLLYNLSRPPASGNFRGTVKFQGQWNLFDQVIVSGSLLSGSHGLFVLPDGYRIFGPSFLLTADEKYNGFKPYRTYNGYRYQGGFSDHLPVYVDVYVRK